MIKNKNKIYLAFFNSKETKLYYNQLKEITLLSYSSLQTVLKKLIGNKEITKEKTKSNTYYKLTNKYKSLEYTKITHNLIENLNIDVKTTINELTQLLPKNIFTCLFFGSASKKQEQENSDIDLLIILDNYKNKKLQSLYNRELKTTINKIKKELETRSIYPISIVYTTKENFKLQEDYLIKEAISTGFPIINPINYYNN